MKDDSEWTFQDFCYMGIFSIFCLLVIVGLFFGIGAAVREYDIWSQRKEGEAQYAHAESTRQIKTLEAKAQMESSKYLAEAEVMRARGVAEANKIIGDSLKGNESYLRYLWIHNLAEGKNQVIYVPTEASLPILEAKR